jgi:hypothetical protein
VKRKRVRESGGTATCDTMPGEKEEGERKRRDSNARHDARRDYY